MQHSHFVIDHEVWEDSKAEEIWLNQFGDQGYSLVGVMPFAPNDSGKARYYFTRAKKAGE